MRLVRDMSAHRLSASSVVAVGSFDGVHRGHRALIRRCVELAGDDCEVAVVTFEPLPQTWFNPGSAPARLSSVSGKLEMLEATGVDLVWMMRFNQRLASMPAREFVQRFLVQALCAKSVVTGEDFRFGNRREGDIALLRQLGEEFGFEPHVVEPVTADGAQVSSSAIRQALADEDMGRARELLGRPFTMRGRIFRGPQLGRKLGYPTANIKLLARPSPLAGIFAVRARIEEGPWMDGVSSLGIRPAIGGTEFLLEVHLFDFDDEVYGRRMETEFIEKIRDEADFPSLDDLVVQMRKDEANARAILDTRTRQNEETM